MNPILAGVILALVYALGWWRGKTVGNPDLVQRLKAMDAASCAALKRAVKVETELEARREVWSEQYRRAVQAGDDHTQAGEG